MAGYTLKVEAKYSATGR